MAYTVGYLIGSLSEKSINRTLAEALIRLAPDSLWGTNSFNHKPSAVIGASPGKIGTAMAQQSLRAVLSYCNSPQMSAPEAYIQFLPGVFSEDGEVGDASTEEFLRHDMEESALFVKRVLTVLPRP